MAVDSYLGGPLSSLPMMLRTVLVSFIVMFGVVLGVSSADAQNPNQAFAGRIMLSSKRFPLQAKSASAYTAAIRKQSQTSFHEAKDTHTWKIHFAGFLKVPLNDLEYQIKIYDLTGKSQQLLLTFDQFTHERGQKTIVSNMTLEKKQVGVNKELLMTMESRGKVLASSKFKILGEGERFSGKVDFSEEEANGKTEEE